MTEQTDSGEQTAVEMVYAAWLTDCIEVLRKFTRCPLGYHHRMATEEDPRLLRHDCADDQCMNPECVTYSQCTNPHHDAARLVAAYDAAMEQPSTAS